MIFLWKNCARDKSHSANNDSLTENINEYRELWTFNHLRETV